MSEIRLSGTLNCNKIEVIINTGAKRKYINEEIVKSLELVTQPSNIKVGELGNGTTTQIIDTTTGQLKLDEFFSYTFFENFDVSKGNLRDILLGNPFLNVHKVMIDYKEHTLRIAGHFFILNSDIHENYKESLYFHLIQSVRLVTLTHSKEKCLARIAELERMSEELRKIPNVA